ncbi:unnamed protein product [Linum tenue]|uniref:Uncharacterized protein n=1 Tax=Linum tenue TaxID=586396 RepID=A0AAV0H5K5_9ROSI|nr:unnamed protein product [Linum tenue]
MTRIAPQLLGGSSSPCFSRKSKAPRVTLKNRIRRPVIEPNRTEKSPENPSLPTPHNCFPNHQS